MVRRSLCWPGNIKAGIVAFLRAADDSWNENGLLLSNKADLSGYIKY